jgi:hypothetical protein
MNKSLIATAISAACLMAPALCAAQFSALLGTKSTSSSSANAGPDLNVQQDSLVRGYVAAGGNVATANGHLAEALGIKAQALDKSVTADALSAKDVEAQDKAVSASANAVSEAIKSGATLKDAQAKVKYAEGLVWLATGLKKYSSLRNEAQGFANGLSGTSPLQLTKFQAGAYVVKSLPTGITNLASVLKTAVDFARSNGVEVPKDATSVL